MENGPVKHRCNICTLELPSSRKLYLHLRTVHYGDIDSPEGKTVKRARIDTGQQSGFRCVICTGEFCSMRDLYRHLRNHFTKQKDNQEDQQGSSRKRRKVDTDSDPYYSLKTHQTGGGSRKRHATESPPGEQAGKRPKTVFKPDHATPSTSKGVSGTKKHVQLRLDGPDRLRMPTAQELDDQHDNSSPTDQHPDFRYHLVENSRRTLKKLGAEEVTYRPVLPPHMNNVRMADVLSSVYYMFDELIGKLKEDMHPNDKIRVVLQHPLLMAPVHVRAVGPEDFKTENLMAQVEKVILIINHISNVFCIIFSI